MKYRHRLVQSFATILRLSMVSNRDLGGEGSSLDPDQVINSPLSPPLSDDNEISVDQGIVHFPSAHLLKYHNTVGPNGKALDPEQAIRARDKIFCEYVKGWAALHATDYRRCVMLDDQMTSKTEPYACHILFRHPDKFLNEVSSGMAKK